MSTNPGKVHLIRLILFILIVCLITPLAAATLAVPEGRLSFSLPSHWVLKGEEKGDFGAIFTFKREPVKDSQGRMIIPAVMVSVRPYDTASDPVHFAAYVRTTFRLQDMIAFYSWHDGRFSLKSGVLFQARKTDTHTGLPHTMLVFTASYGKYSLIIVCNVPTELFPRVADDFFGMFKSLRLETRLPVPEIIEVRGPNHIAIKARDGEFGMVKRMLKGAGL